MKTYKAHLGVELPGYGMKKTLLPFLLFVFGSTVNAGAPQTELRYLSGTDKDHPVTWEFKVNGGRNSDGWQTIPVPSNWEMQGFGSYRYWCDWCEEPAPDSQGQYRFRFTVPPDWAGKAVFLVFGGVMTDAEVRVNGALAGPVHRGGFYQFSYPVTGLLRFGGENLLEVKVNRFSSNTSINLAERRADFWLFSGIYRPVWLEAKPKRHIKRIDLDARHTGDFLAEVSLEPGASAKGADRLTATLKQLNGEPVGAPVSVKISPDQSAARIQSFVKDIVPWSAENPHRYQVTFQLRRGRRVLHEVTEVFGFRTIDLRPRDGLYINGEKVRLKGVNRHAFWPDSGRTTSARISVQDVELMKDMNMNAVRVAHYPPDSHFLEATDRLGLYVINELTGWQDAYDTEVGEPLVKELIQRDTNHPSVIMWANGNEGGWNRELDDDFHQWDIQKRPVIHPWDNFGGIDTAHYNRYNCCTGRLFDGKDLIMPTEFLHALFDGGAAAGLDDWWRQMMAHPLAVGGFIWAFADEGIVREDQNGAIDVAGNSAPDGIVGPYREKEGSFFAVKEIWSPIYFPLSELDVLPASFDGSFRVENRYDFTHLDQIDFSWELVTFPGPGSARTGHQTRVKKTVNAPNIPPGLVGQLALELPDDWHSYDALLLTATDRHQRDLYTWSWMIAPAQNLAQRALGGKGEQLSVIGRAKQGLVHITRGDLHIAIDAATGYLHNVKRGNTQVSLTQGPRPASGGLGESKLTALTHQARGDDYVVLAEYDGALKRIEWRLRSDGWLQLDYAYQMPADTLTDYLGVSFDYPEKAVKGVKWLGKGPYRVWKNRTKGVEFNVWQKDYNDTVTGMSWDYPEFKGFHHNVHWARLNTSELPITMVFATGELALRLFTPTEADALGSDPRATHVDFPPGDISLLHGIAPIGTKFRPASEHGPSGAPNSVPKLGSRYSSRVYFYFGDILE